MRTFIFILFSLTIFAACQQNENNNAANTAGNMNAAPDTTQFTTIEWMETSKDFGKITEGEKLEVSFKFKNTGDKPLVIDIIKPSCGCTVIDQPEKPVAPGETGEIKGAFNSAGKPGVQHKSIFVHANTKGSQDHNLVFEVEVLKKAE